MSPKKHANTLFTPQQVRVLKLKEDGKTVEEISKILGVSRADVHAIIRNAYKTIAKARETIKLYNEIVGLVNIEFNAGVEIEEFINKVYEEADLAGIKLGLRTSDLILEVMKLSLNCVNPWSKTIECPIKVVISRNGKIRVKAYVGESEKE